tara:strand:- start:94 stop:342 length:249 start_codon:yes stop_codon:yes gene_type:complete
MINLPNGIYQHYKGQHYEVIGLAHHTETKKPMVLYKALYPLPELEQQYGNTVIFTRPYDLFIESVIIKNKKVPRFKLIKSHS